MTNGSVAISEGCLRRARLGEYVAKAMDVTAVQRWKPAGAVYAHAAAELGLEPEQARAAQCCCQRIPGGIRKLIIACTEQKQCVG